MDIKTEKLKPEETAEKVKKSMLNKTKKNVEKSNVVLNKLVVEYMDINKLQPNDWNPNRQDEHDFELLIRSIQEDGFTQPVIIHLGTNIIIDGEHRWRAAISLGMTEIPVVKVDMPIEQMKMSTIRHNKARGHHDIELEAEILKDLEKLGALDWAKDSLMLSDQDLEKLLHDVEAPEAFGSKEDFGTAWQPDKVVEVNRTSEEVKIIKSADGDDIVINSTKQSIDAMRTRETEIKEAKTEEERNMARKKNEIFKLSLIYSNEQAVIIKQVLGSRPAEKILELCQKELGA